MIKIETHCHSKGGSHCAHVTPEELVKEYIDAGYGGAVLTNHYCRVCYEDEYPGQTHAEKLDHYFSLFDKLKEVGDKHGFKVFLGAEVCAVRADGLYSEFMLYGFDRSLLYDNPPLFHLTQKEMFEFAEKHGLFMYQTHPFREGVAFGDPRYIHGAESFNGQIYHINNNGSAEEFCKKYKLKMMSGSDYHDAGQPITGGIYIPENINTEKELVDYLFGHQPKLIEDKTYIKKLKISGK